MFSIKKWNQQIQEEIQELEILIETEKISLQYVVNEINENRHDPYFQGYYKFNLYNLKRFIKSSIQELEQNVLQLRNRIITCS